MYISTPHGPKVENLLPRWGLNPEPAEPEADMLPSEPTRLMWGENLYTKTGMWQSIFDIPQFNTLSKLMQRQQ